MRKRNRMRKRNIAAQTVWLLNRTGACGDVTGGGSDHPSGAAANAIRPVALATGDEGALREIEPAPVAQTARG